MGSIHVLCVIQFGVLRMQLPVAWYGVVMPNEFKFHEREAPIDH